MNAALLMVGTLGLLAGFGANAEELPAPPDSVEARAIWIDTGFATRHFSHSRTLNGANRGLGIEYGLREDLAFTGGRFYNSSRNWSNYAGVLWQPLSYGRWRLGAVAVAMHGYPRMRHGGWFPAVIPAASYEFERVGLNIGIVPSYRDRLHGGISLQLKFKVWN